MVTEKWTLFGSYRYSNFNIPRLVKQVFYKIFVHELTSVVTKGGTRVKQSIPYFILMNIYVSSGRKAPNFTIDAVFSESQDSWFRSSVQNVTAKMIQTTSFI